MKQIIIAAAALLAVTASAQAETYNVEGVTIHVGAGCRSTSCVSVNAPGYGSYRGRGVVHAHKSHKDTTRVASTRKEDAATAPAVAAAQPAAAKAPDTAPAAALPAVPDAAPAK